MIETGDMQFESRMVTPKQVEEDSEVEVSLRPQSLLEYIGQDKVKENLAVYIEAAKRRGDPLDHVLLYGPPGLGKTTLSAIIAHEMGVNLRVTTGPAIEKAGDLAAILTNLQPNDVLFIDEIHRLNRQVEEILYPALEDHAIDIIMGKGPSARSLRVDLNPFTLVGATTRAGQLSSPLRDRFGVILRLELYTTEQLTDIVRRSAMLLKIPCSIDGATEIAGRARGTPRIANRLLKRVRDFADVMGDGEITQDIAHMALDRLEIDELGLDSNDRRMLEMIIKGYGGGPVGLETLASALGEETVTLEDVCEPYLMQLGFQQQIQPNADAASVALPEGMGDIHLHILLDDLVKGGLGHLVDVSKRRLQIHQRRKAEIALCQIHRAQFACKVINILEKRLMNGLQRRESAGCQLVQRAAFKQFYGFLLAGPFLLAGKLGGVGDAKFIFKCHRGPPCVCKIVSQSVSRRSAYRSQMLFSSFSKAGIKRLIIS